MRDFTLFIQGGETMMVDKTFKYYHPVYPYYYCYKHYGRCFSCSGVFCIGMAEFIANKLFWETYSYE